MKDRRLKLREIASTVGISYERVQNIVHNHFIRPMGTAFAHKGTNAKSCRHVAAVFGHTEE